ncbi:MAG: hypothetical protein OXF98_12080 [Rhodospirillaceae bacterium]|nr:hypothetical protein [Rhodospirillaceae bacterium]
MTKNSPKQPGTNRLGVGLGVAGLAIALIGLLFGNNLFERFRQVPERDSTQSPFTDLSVPAVSQTRPHCSQEDRDYAASQGYDAEDAYEFGRIIQQHVANQDMAGLFSLVDGELEHGPRRRFAAGRTFGDVFPQDWRSAVVGSEPECGPVGYRRFMLAAGRIWYGFDRFDSGEWEIFSIIGATEERYPLTGSGLAWRIAGEIIEPECFERQWLSFDNFELLEEAFAIADTNDFRRNTGRYVGREIDSIDPIDAAWGADTVRLVTFPPVCQPNGPEVPRVARSPAALSGDDVASEYCDGSGYCVQSVYRLLAPIPLVACQTLAPHMIGRCESAYLLRTEEDSGGSMGPHVTFNIFGLFALDDGRRAMVPLVNLNNENDARNFIDDIAIRH